MQLHFVKASPCRNTTVFMEGDIPRSAYAALGRLAMDAEYLAAEQAGFLTEPHTSSSVLRLEMAGGEFCGNAVLALAALAVKRGLAEAGASFFVECSGASQPLSCRVIEKGDGHFASCAAMPAPLELRSFTLRACGTDVRGGLVELSGIVHFCAETAGFSDAMYDALTDALEAAAKSDAFGIIAYEKLGASEYRIRPYVSVPNAKSRVFEQACGSGSLSLGLWLRRQGGARQIHVGQPGGVLSIDTSGAEASVTADVFFPCEGEMRVSDTVFAARRS